MARDRQRAKRRRAERKEGARSTSDRAREIGLGDGPDAVEPALGREPDAVDSPLGEGTGAPDPLRHSSAEVDQARLAETGAPPPGEDDGGAGIYADELAPERAVRPRGNRFISFLGHCVDELRRVQWPNRRHVGQATAVVLGFVVIAGGYLGLLDALWQPLIEAIL